jgi:hypothetical protein
LTSKSATLGQKASKPRKRAIPDGPIEVTLQHGRWRHFGWSVFSLVVGFFLVWKFGAVGKAIGLILLGLAALNALRFARTLLHAPGTFKIDKKSLSLPAGLCRGKAVEIADDELHHVFFLRKAVPWTRAGPVLIIEAKGRVYSYPRDWFVSDSDQRRIALALNRRLGRI